MFRIILFLFFTTTVFSQKSEVNALLTEGAKAATKSDFKLAKEIYQKAFVLDSINKNVLYNLAATELNLGEVEGACEHLYRNYILGDYESLPLLQEYCPNIRKGTIYLRSFIETPEKFTYEDKEYQLVENGDLNPTYKKILVKEIKRSKLLKGKIEGKLYIAFSINPLGIFDGRIIRMGVEKKDEELCRMEVLRIFRQIVKYTPAQVNGKSVEVLQKLMLPLDFGMNPN